MGTCMSVQEDGQQQQRRASKNAPQPQSQQANDQPTRKISLSSPIVIQVQPSPRKSKSSKSAKKEDDNDSDISPKLVQHDSNSTSAAPSVKTTQLLTSSSASTTASATSTQSSEDGTLAGVTKEPLTPQRDSPRMHLSPSDVNLIASTQRTPPSQMIRTRANSNSFSPALNTISSRRDSASSQLPQQTPHLHHTVSSSSMLGTATLGRNSRLAVDLSQLLPTPRRQPHLGGVDGLHSFSHPSVSPVPTLPRAITPTVHTSTIETGLTEDGFYHINQYIVEMGKWKREAMRRKEAKARRRAEIQAAREARERDNGLSIEDDEFQIDGEVEVSSDSESEEEEEEEGEDEEEQATILGRGSYGVVKKVFNTQDGQFYAMKIMNKSLLSRTRAFGKQQGEDDGIEAVKREVAIMKKLNHPNIVKLSEVLCDPGNEEDNVYLVMEYAEGGSIMKVDMDEGEVEFEDGSANIVSEPIQPELARKYFRDILAGLDYLHHQQIIHRDIKPENLLVSADGRALIGDFGVSKMCENDDNIIASSAGTACFMSPECIKNGSRNSQGFDGAKSDIFSLGVTLFYMLYGRLPWYSKSLPEIYRKIVEEPLVFPEGLEFAHIPRAAQCLIHGMLQKDPNERYTIARMMKCPWVTAEGTYNPADYVCEAYKNKPLVAATVCQGDIAHALVNTHIEKDVTTIAVTPKSECVIGKMMTRLASWKRDMSRRCDQKKAQKAHERALKRATLGASVMGSQGVFTVAEAQTPAEQQLSAALASNRRATTGALQCPYAVEAQ